MIVNYIKRFFSGHERTIKAKKQIIFSLLFKGISIVIGLAFVPLILNFLDAERYGIWLTLSSILAWFSFFDIGLGNGLRNRLTEAFANKDFDLARTYVSTTYAILAMIFLLVLILFFVINPFIDWQTVLNTNVVGSNELSEIASIVFAFFILGFYFKLIGTILMADQRPGVSNSFGPLGNLFSFLIILILTKTTEGSLFILATVFSIIPVAVVGIASLYFFSKDYKRFSPSFVYVDLSKSKDLLSLGVKFFLFQTASIVFFSTTNFLIAQFENQEMVAAYNVAYKYLFTINMVYGIVLMPFWSAVTDAYVKKDFIWLKNSLRKLNIISISLVFILIGALLLSPVIYHYWVGDKLNIPFALSLAITIYLIQQVIVAPFSVFINGIGKLKLGLYLIIMGLVLFIPLAYILGKNYGAIGVVVSMILVQVPASTIQPIQIYKILNKTAKGIWNR